ncbi:cell wall-binding repeat-containing protein, partial [Peptacetobacter sp.]|uniref:cell wall-binding repeat-containing protein n=1 Tax=Peptacetobacter sp. TaxID=2991975 RepID=UPI0026325ACE
MKFKEKASSLVLAAIMLTSSVMPVSAARKDAIVGGNRYETAGKIADRMGSYNKAILVNGNSIADGLSASSLAGKENAPILLVKKDSIPKETLKRLYNVKKVYIIGKEGAISQRVEKSLNQSGMATERIGGDDRIDTSLEVSRKIGNYSKAFVVNGYKGQADAMSAASVAAREKAPIILTNGKEIPTYTRSGVKYYVVGGDAVVNEYVRGRFNAERLSGSNRYGTNKVVVKKFYPNSSKYYFAKGDELVDALTVSVLAKDNGVVLVSGNSDKSVMNNKDKVQVGGMKDSIVDSVFSNNPAPKPEPGEKPNKP